MTTEVLLLSGCQQKVEPLKANPHSVYSKLLSVSLETCQPLLKQMFLHASVASRSIFGIKMGYIFELAMLFMSGIVKAQSARMLLGKPMSIRLID